MSSLFSALLFFVLFSGSLVCISYYIAFRNEIRRHEGFELAQEAEAPVPAVLTNAELHQYDPRTLINSFSFDMNTGAAQDALKSSTYEHSHRILSALMLSQKMIVAQSDVVNRMSEYSDLQQTISSHEAEDYLAKARFVAPSGSRSKGTKRMGGRIEAFT